MESRRVPSEFRGGEENSFLNRAAISSRQRSHMKNEKIKMKQAGTQDNFKKTRNEITHIQSVLSYPHLYVSSMRVRKTSIGREFV